MLSTLQTKHNIGGDTYLGIGIPTVIRTALSHLFWYKMEWTSKNALTRAIINDNQELAPIVTFYRGHSTGSPVVALSVKRTCRFSKGTRFARCFFYAITASFSENNKSFLCQSRHCPCLSTVCSSNWNCSCPSTHWDDVFNRAVPLSTVSSATWAICAKLLYIRDTSHDRLTA